MERKLQACLIQGRLDLAKLQGAVKNGPMEYSARVVSSVLFVSQLERSVNFYCDVFGCEQAIREEGAALLLASGGFQVYLIERGTGAAHHVTGIGPHLLMWATDSMEGLEYFEKLLKEMSDHTYTHSAGGVTFVEARDPDGIRVVIAHPDPEQLPRSILDLRLYL
ncbi:Glyoxalase/Bleomycin resistance protein/Dioxygenase superfamily protein [Arthrobacter crystallopoietes]|uniref:Glyoxalase/Bleomycin resistance protein/Dioxygenase superfamily protein n=2 Tax=Crystallibacter crystallopoietes TaxID=37928 RepID=A0A1H1CT14_9MICC|nr:Glyoxalase/Bleomycin resistance protein/Dioxygenase superfamily protein [Arthrobacter crystallopoietes]